MKTVRLSYVEYETASLARDKGYREWCSAYYETAMQDVFVDEDGDECVDGELAIPKGYTEIVYGNHRNAETEDADAEWTTCSAPTQAGLQRWLREIHNIQVYAYSHTKVNGKWIHYIAVVDVVSLNDARDEEFETYEEALEVGLHYALNRI